MEAPIHHNIGTDPDLAFAAVHEIEKLRAELLSEKMASAARCRGIKAREATTFEEFRDKGIPKAFLKGVIKIRELSAKLDDVKESIAESGAEQGDLFINFLASVERGEADHNTRPALISEAAE